MFVDKLMGKGVIIFGGSSLAVLLNFLLFYALGYSAEKQEI